VGGTLREGDRRVLVTGGAGYVGAPLCEELAAAGWRVRVLDVLLHGQEEVAASLERQGVELVRGDVRDADARRQALDGVQAVVHLAAIVGDPACALDPDLAEATNVEGSRALVHDADAAGVDRFVFASTCSNYGRMADPEVPVDETGVLAPVSLYARQKVAVETELLGGNFGRLKPTCLRFATVYGVAPRMRFDLTVNEFTREIWGDRDLEVFGEQFWRPYVHVRDAGRAVLTVLGAPDERVASTVFNVGRSDQNFRKLDLSKMAQDHLGRGRVTFVHRDEDPRDYRVSFEKIASQLGYGITMTVDDGIKEVAAALDEGEFPDPYSGQYRNIP
jgi:nucleoside-diphosphate-sugar epimerase